MTLEEQYKQETGKLHYSTIGNIWHYTDEFVEWVKHFLTLAVERFRAGEDMRPHCIDCRGKDYGCPLSACSYYDKWQNAIAAYEAAVKGEGK